MEYRKLQHNRALLLVVEPLYLIEVGGKNV
jgi:hypothetical protein